LSLKAKDKGERDSWISALLKEKLPGINLEDKSNHSFLSSSDDGKPLPSKLNVL
jgi:hypothetical protein